MAGPGIISGVVHDDRGRPVANARIFFTAGPDPLPDIAALTTQEGTFSITAPHSGRYTIQCVADGFVPKNEIVMASAGRTVHLNIEVHKEK